MSEFSVGIIGCGNMGAAITRGMIAKDILPADSIFLYDKDIEKLERLSGDTGCAKGDLAQMVRGCTYLIIAVKPQDFDALAKVIAPDMVDQTIISVMAGVKTSDITRKLGKGVPVVRAMPNMAAAVSESITCVTCNDASKIDEGIKSVFAGIGKVMEVDESFMDAVTAVSGSGPAYLFYLAEAMIEAGRKLGFGEVAARELVIQTLYGSAVLLRKGEASPSELIKKVASKGGTTEAALNVFNETDMMNIIKNAIVRAKERSEELSGGA